jgi:hypothetical protein
MTGTPLMSWASVLANEFFPFIDRSFVIFIILLFCLFRDTLTTENVQRR